MPILVIAFVCGIGLFQQLQVLPESITVVVILLLALLAGFLNAWRLCVFYAGWLWAGLFAVWHLHAQLPSALEGQELAIAGIISSLPQRDEHKTRFDFKVTQAPVGVPVNLKLNWYHPKPRLLAGQRWSFKVKLKKNHGLFNPGSFDYERWLFAQNIGATGYVRAPEQATLLGQQAAWQSITVLRQAIANQIAGYTSLQYPAFIKALTIGNTDDITPEQWQVLQKTGTLHLIAISGSHISLIAGLIYFMVRFGWVRTMILSISPQQVAAAAAMGMAQFYALLAGGSVPTQRAMIMLSVAMLGLFLQRHVRPSQTLAIALLLIVLYDPLAVLSPGLWLSFGAVALIFFMISGRLSKPSLWTGIFKIHAMMALGLAPILLCLFQQISFISPIANLIAVPVIGVVIVPVAITAVLFLGWAPSISKVLLVSVDFCLKQLWWLMQTLAEWPHAGLSGFSTSVMAMLLASMGVMILCMPKGLPGRWLGGVLCLPLLFNAPPKLLSGAVKVTVLDVGQGLATVIQTAEHVLIFDTGIKFSEQSDSGKSVILPFLASQSIQHVDGLIISHGDNDHIGGTASLLARFTPTWIVTSVVAQLQPFAAQSCVQGQHWVWDAVEFVMLASKPEPFVSENDNSCVLQIKTTHGSMLLTGDIEKSAEAWLVETYADQLKSDVLVAPHHGSNTSSTAEFLKFVSPALVLISSGYHNQFHFPHPAVLARYQQQQSQWLNTAEQGAISVTLSGKDRLIAAYRQTAGKYWQAAVTQP